jgi:hypothetical protein
LAALFRPALSFTRNTPTVNVIDLSDVGALSQQFTELVVGDGVDGRLEGFMALARFRAIAQTGRFDFGDALVLRHVRPVVQHERHSNGDDRDDAEDEPQPVDPDL